MEYEKHVKRLVLGYLKKECKNAFKVFLKYNFHRQHKYIPTRVAGQTLEDILRIYSRIEEIVQGRLEDTNFYREKSVEFTSPIYLDDQLLYLLDKDRPFTPTSTPCPRSPAESSIVESQHESEVLINDVETTPEHTLPGNSSLHDNNYQSRTPFRNDSPICTTPCIEKLSTSDKETFSKVLTLKVPEKTDFQKKLAGNVNTTLNTADIPCFSHRGENEKNKEGVGTDLDDMLQDFLGTPIVNALGKAVSADACTNSNTLEHSTIASKNWQHIDDHNNRAVSSLLAAASIPNTKSANFVTTTNDNTVYNDNLNDFQEPPVSSTPQLGPTPTSFTSNQYLLPTSVGMYIVPQPTTTTIQNGNQQQQFYIVNQPVVIPQPGPVMQLLQPVAPANNPVVIHPNQKTPLTKDNANLMEQDIMTMPTIILNERNEITYADPGNFPAKGNEAHNIKEYVNLFGASDQSPILKLNSQTGKNKCHPPIKPTPTIKVEIFRRDTLPPVTVHSIEPIGTPNVNIHSVPNKSNTSSAGCTGLPNLNDIIESEPVTKIHEDPIKLKNKEFSNAIADESKIDCNDKTIPRLVGSVCTPSPLKTAVRKPTPKSSSHIRNLSFPSPIRKTSEKPDSKRNSPRIINKRHAAKDLFKEGNEEKKLNTKTIKTSRQIAKSPTKITGKNLKQSSKSPKTILAKEKTKSFKNTTKKGVKENSLKQIEEDMIPKCSWDTNLRKSIPVIIEENNSTPVRRASTRRKTRQSAELDVSDADGKKLEDALKTPEKNDKPKRKTPSRKKSVKTLNNKKLEEKPQSQVGDTKSVTKILSPSKLKANKRNILSNDKDDVTPNILKESSQYPVSSKTRRNISSLLETPIKEDFIPPTPGAVPEKTETPFTPMLRANLKDFTEGDTFSINTPNFPVTPGLAAMVNTSAAYYILNDNEHNKVTEATVLSEEKKSSVRKSDDEDVELSPRVYGSKEILDNFNKSCVGKKNLELLDNRGVTWDGSSDREEKSGDNSENNSEDEPNNTVIQNKEVNQPKEITVLPKLCKSSGKCMATLHSQLLKEIKNPPETFNHDLESSSQEVVNAKPQNDEEDKGGKQSNKDEINANKITKCSSSGSDSEVLSKKSYGMKKDGQIESKQISSSDCKSEMSCKIPDNVLKNKGKDADKKIKSKIERNNEHITGDKCAITTQEVRQTISDVCLENTLVQKPASASLKAQLEEKKKRWIELEKTKPTLNIKKTPRRRATKPQPNFNSARSKRKLLSPKRVVRSPELNKKKEVPECGNEKIDNAESNVKENELNKTSLGSKNQIDEVRSEVSPENHTVDSQDEFFKKSGTNLHRKNKGNAHTTKKASNSRKDLDDNIKDKAETEFNTSTNKICHDDQKCNNQQQNEIEKNSQKNLKEPTVEKSRNQDILSVQTEDVQNIYTDSNNIEEFEKSWEDCQISEIESEHVFLYHDESKTHNKKLEDYDFSILQKKIVLGLPCSDGSTVNVVITSSSFNSLLEIKPANEYDTADGSRDADSSFESLKRKCDALSDSENAENKTDDVDDVKCAKKRKHRSDSSNSNSSTKKMKKSEILNEKNIQKVLAKIHGPSKQE